MRSAARSLLFLCVLAVSGSSSAQFAEWDRAVAEANIHGLPPIIENCELTAPDLARRYTRHLCGGSLDDHPELGIWLDTLMYLGRLSTLQQDCPEPRIEVQALEATTLPLNARKLELLRARAKRIKPEHDMFIGRTLLTLEAEGSPESAALYQELGGGSPVVILPSERKRYFDDPYRVLEGEPFLARYGEHILSTAISCEGDRFLFLLDSTRHDGCLRLDVECHYLAVVVWTSRGWHLEQVNCATSL